MQVGTGPVLCAARRIRRRHPALGDVNISGFVNIGGEPVALSEKTEILLSSGPLIGRRRPKDIAVWLSGARPD
jgi:hypothetical protein